MKKIKIIVALILSFILIYLLQLNLFNNYTIGGIKPNVFIIFIVFIMLYTNKKYIIICSAIFGFILDILLSNMIGISSIIFIAIGIVTSYLEKYLSKESKLTIILIVIGATISYEFTLYIVQALKYNSIIELKVFFKMCLVETLYNVILTIILYPIMQKAGHYVEENIKNKNSAKYL